MSMLSAIGVRLSEVPVARPMRVIGIAAHAIATRLMEIGLIEGAEVEVLGRAPFGGPLRLRLGGGQFALRTDEAKLIHVTDR